MIKKNNKTRARAVMDDTECVTRILHGGIGRERGVAVLFDRYAAPFFGYFLKQGLARMDAEDLVQEVFVQVVKKINSYQGEGSFRSWIWAIARNRLISEMRKSHRDISGANPEPDADSQCSDTAAIVADNDLEECVREGFKQFATKHAERAQGLALWSFHGWTILEIARFLDRSPGATREYLSQCRKKLRPYLEPCFGLLETG